VVHAVYGAYLLAWVGQNLKFGVVVVTAAAHVAVNNHLKVADQALMLVRLFVLFQANAIQFAQAVRGAVLKMLTALVDSQVLCKVPVQ
jgi:hypothetical protein